MKQNTANTATAIEGGNIMNTFKFNAMEAYKGLGYVSTKAPETPAKVTATIKRDHSIEAVVRSIMYRNDIAYSTVEQDPKGRVTIYNPEQKPLLKYRPHKTGIVVFFPKRSRRIAEEMGLKLTGHGYFGSEGAIDTDKETLITAVQKLADLEA